MSTSQKGLVNQLEPFEKPWIVIINFPVHEIYLISFFNKFNFVNYITRWKNSLHIIHALKIFKLQISLEWTNKKNLWSTN
jgi:hypothetical protein